LPSHPNLKALAADTLKPIPFPMFRENLKKKPQKCTHIKIPIFDLSPWVSTVFSNALGNTVAPNEVFLNKVFSLLSPISSHIPLISYKNVKSKK
jgi:hypothetical protein